MTAPVEVLVFDVFGTVVDWRGSLIRQIPDVLAPFGLEVDVAAFADAWRARYQPSMERVRSGARPWVPLDTLHRESLDEVCAEFGLDALPAHARDALNRFWHRLDGWPDAAAGLRALARHGFCCALSNGNLRLMADVARHADLAWDQILGAEWSKAYKPEPRVYLDAADAFAVPPERVLMVAAHNNDLDAARALGLQTAFVRRQTEHGPGQTTDLAPTGSWTYVADDLLDLARKLGDAADPGPRFHMVAGGPRPVAPFSHAVEDGGWVFLTGQMPTDPADPEAPLPDGIAAQTHRVMANLEIVLDGLGLTLADVCMCRCYLAAFERDYAAFNAAYQSWFPADRRPARTTIGVTALAVGALVEIDLVARRPGTP